MGNREWGTGNGEHGMGTGNEEQGIGIGTGNTDGEWEHETHGNGE